MSGLPGVLAPRSRNPRFGAPLAAEALLATLLLLLVYALWRPLSPDLAAQVARADVVRHAGPVSFWTGWFGGLSLPSYSVVVPDAMAAVGVHLTGILAVLAGTLAGIRLSRDTARPRLAAASYALAGVADLFAGRITFAVGLALATWALVALRARRPSVVVGLGILAFLASPLAGLFLGLIELAVAVVDRGRRLAAALGAASLLASGGMLALLYPGTGTMPFHARDLVMPALCCALLIAACPTPVVRACSVAVLLSLPVFYLDPGAVGSNISRILWVAAVPIVCASARWPRRWTVALAVGLALWPAIDLVNQLAYSRDRASTAGFYTPLIRELAHEQAASGPATVGSRVEVLDTISHWATVYVAQSQPIARGWDRQADNADNPIFYQPGELTAGSYHAWLGQLAVGWIAVPNARLDSASVDEAALIARGLPYLTQVWQTRDWTLYRVADPQSFAAGARTLAVTDDSVTLKPAGPGTVELKLRYSPYLALIDPATKQRVGGCISDVNGWTELSLPSSREVQVVTSFDVDAQLQAARHACEG